MSESYQSNIVIVVIITVFPLNANILNEVTKRTHSRHIPSGASLPSDVNPFSVLISDVTVPCNRLGSVSMHLLIHLEQSNTDRLQGETATWEVRSITL